MASRLYSAYLFDSLVQILAPNFFCKIRNHWLFFAIFIFYFFKTIDPRATWLFFSPLKIFLENFFLSFDLLNTLCTAFPILLAREFGFFLVFFYEFRLDGGRLFLCVCVWTDAPGCRCSREMLIEPFKKRKKKDFGWFVVWYKLGPTPFVFYSPPAGRSVVRSVGLDLCNTGTRWTMGGDIQEEEEEGKGKTKLTTRDRATSQQTWRAAAICCCLKPGASRPRVGIKYIEKSRTARTGWTRDGRDGRATRCRQIFRYPPPTNQPHKNGSIFSYSFLKRSSCVQMWVVGCRLSRKEKEKGPKFIMLNEKDLPVGADWRQKMLSVQKYKKYQRRGVCVRK